MNQSVIDVSHSTCVVSPENVPLDITDQEHGENQVWEKQHVFSWSLGLRIYINKDLRKTCIGPGILNWQEDFMTFFETCLGIVCWKYLERSY